MAASFETITRGMVNHGLDELHTIVQLALRGINLSQRQLGLGRIGAAAGIDGRLEVLGGFGQIAIVGRVGAQEKLGDVAFLSSRILGEPNRAKLSPRRFLRASAVGNDTTYSDCEGPMVLFWICMVACSSSCRASCW